LLRPVLRAGEVKHNIPASLANRGCTYNGFNSC